MFGRECTDVAFDSQCYTLGMSQSVAPVDPLVPPVEKLYDGTSSVQEFIDFGEGFVNTYSDSAGRPAAFCVVSGRGLRQRVGCTRADAPPVSPGRYEGLDINRESVEWLQERYRPYPAFHFTHANVHNKMYNPGGVESSASYRLPYPDATFDVALLKSVFTHMLPEEVRHYLSELARVLKPTGRVVVTYFLLNQESLGQMSRGKDLLKMDFDWQGDPLCRIADRAVPEAAVAHDELRIRNYSIEAGLSVHDITFGNWCGRPSFLGFQDLMILVRP